MEGGSEMRWTRTQVVDWRWPGCARTDRTGHTGGGASWVPHGAPNDPGERTMSTRTEGARGRSRVRRASALATRRTPRRGRRAVYALSSPPPRVPWSVSCLHACLAECRCRAVRPGQPPDQPPSCHVPARFTHSHAAPPPAEWAEPRARQHRTPGRESSSHGAQQHAQQSVSTPARTPGPGAVDSLRSGSLRSPDFRFRSLWRGDSGAGLRDGRDSNTAPRHSPTSTTAHTAVLTLEGLGSANSWPRSRGGPRSLRGPGPGRVEVVCARAVSPGPGG